MYTKVIEYYEQMLDDYPELLTIDEACGILYVSNTTLYRMCKRGDLEYLKLGGLKRIPRISVVRYIIRNTQKGKNPYFKIK
ncbi:MAG: helix-turn-helix domain-containing protein [Clostridia bacterium]|nr:helix-turn-helix domain-containing protein [Clostridia bacterium]